jgi:hypothetical protein
LEFGPSLWRRVRLLAAEKRKSIAVPTMVETSSWRLLQNYFSSTSLSSLRNRIDCSAIRRSLIVVGFDNASKLIQRND